MRCSTFKVHKFKIPDIHERHEPGSLKHVNHLTTRPLVCTRKDFLLNLLVYIVLHQNSLPDQLSQSKISR